MMDKLPAFALGVLVASSIFLYVSLWGKDSVHYKAKIADKELKLFECEQRKNMEKEALKQRLEYERRLRENELYERFKLPEKKEKIIEELELALWLWNTPNNFIYGDHCIEDKHEFEETKKDAIKAIIKISEHEMFRKRY